MRSSTYDTLSLNLNQLRQTSLREDKILKSEDSGKFERVILVHKESDALCKLIAEQFISLRRDWIGGKINKARYVDNLKPLADYLEEGKGVTLPKEITDEVSKYF